MNVIAIDGPSGSGKSTVAILVASALNISYINSGLLYRTVTYLVSNLDESKINDHAFISDVIKNNEIVYDNQEIFVNNENITHLVTNEMLTKFLPAISANPIVRDRVNEIVRSVASTNDIIIDGRDIGTVMFPNAYLKIFLEADVEVRAKRRYEEVKDKGFNYEEILERVIRRDEIDTNREVAPLKCADDAVVIDSSYLSVEEIVSKIVYLYNKKGDVL